MDKQIVCVNTGWNHNDRLHNKIVINKETTTNRRLIIYLIQLSLSHLYTLAIGSQSRLKFLEIFTEKF